MKTFSMEDCEYLHQVLRAESANVIRGASEAQLTRQLGPLVREAGADSGSELVSMLRADRTPALKRAVAEAMTVNETSFFRDTSAFDSLRDTILPALIRENAETRTLRIWSAASSTGQEAYSLAMLLCEHFPQLGGWDVEILGTDISRQVIEYARAARYKRIEVNRGLPARLLLKYMLRNGEAWEVIPRVKRMCTFESVNLRDLPDGLGRFDLVLMRNVLLYFPQGDRTGVFRAIHARLSAKGYLILGAAEQAEESTKLFQPQFAKNCYFYRPVPEHSCMR
jgi:chemotaxis protein methyltransferase CheR